jgi:predicted metal-dependent phosphoesterase TrpH
VPATIDLHLHTTASDGRSTPDELVRQVRAAGIRVLSVTDHDTRASEAAVRAAATAAGLTFISGIEITSVENGRDIHVLAYGLPPDAPALEAVVAAQRGRRLERAREIARKLDALGAPIDIAGVVAAAAASGKAVARPQLAQCLVDAGHVHSVQEAFDRYLDQRSPAYVANEGISPADVVALVASSGGVASLAHPGQLRDQTLIERLAAAGLPCLEVFHSSHDAAAEAHYLALANRLGLAVTGGSDFHGDGTRRAELFGRVGLPEEHMARLEGLMEQASHRAALVGGNLS